MASPSRSSGPFQRLAGHDLLASEVELGRISGVFGVRGEVRLFLFNPSPFLAGAARAVVLIDPQGGRWVATLRTTIMGEKRIKASVEGVGDRDQARALKDWRIAVSKEDLPALEGDEFYVWQVEGLTVRDGGDPIGTVVTLHHTAGGDLFEVKVGDESHFVPALREFVRSVDLEAGVVDIVPGAIGS